MSVVIALFCDCTFIRSTCSFPGQLWKERMNSAWSMVQDSGLWKLRVWACPFDAGKCFALTNNGVSVYRPTSDRCSIDSQSQHLNFYYRVHSRMQKERSNYCFLTRLAIPSALFNLLSWENWLTGPILMKSSNTSRYSLIRLSLIHTTHSPLLFITRISVSGVQEGI